MNYKLLKLNTIIDKKSAMLNCSMFIQNNFKFPLIIIVNCYQSNSM